MTLDVQNLKLLIKVGRNIKFQWILRLNCNMSFIFPVADNFFRWELYFGKLLWLPRVLCMCGVFKVNAGALLHLWKRMLVQYQQYESISKFPVSFTIQFFVFFCLSFLSRTFTNHGRSGEFFYRTLLAHNFHAQTSKTFNLK